MRTGYPKTKKPGKGVGQDEKAGQRNARARASFIHGAGILNKEGSNFWGEMGAAAPIV
jgi:hypothetical protein